MNQEEVEQGWQKVQAHINLLFRKYLRNDYPAIEHKPNDLILLQLPPGYKMEEAGHILNTGTDD